MIDATNMSPSVRHALRALALLVSAGIVLAQPAAPSWRVVAPGVEHAHITRPAPRGGSWNVNALRLDLSTVRLDVIRARDAGIGVETVTSIAERTGAIAAINGGYFRMTGDFRGDSTGTVQIDGVLWSEPDRGRASVGFVREGTATRLVFGHVVWDGHIEAGTHQHAIDGLNRARGPDELVVFTPQFGPVTATDASGIEAIVRSGTVTAVLDRSGGNAIPEDGFVVSARGKGREWVRRALLPGERVRIATMLLPADPSDGNPWADAEDVLGAGPKLVTGGQVDVTDVREKMLPTFATDLHPRTAIARLADGRGLLLVADGRHPPDRVGLSLAELAGLLIELGSVEAINLDGGGSTAMVVQGALVNVPSDPTGERPVSDAIVVRPASPSSPPPR